MLVAGALVDVSQGLAARGLGACKGQSWQGALRCTLLQPGVATCIPKRGVAQSPAAVRTLCKPSCQPPLQVLLELKGLQRLAYIPNPHQE